MPDARLTLYTHPMSRGRVARWMVEATGLPYVFLQAEDGIRDGIA